MKQFLSEYEYTIELDFDEVENFDSLSKLASRTINAYTGGFYNEHSFDEDFKTRQEAVKLACAYQINYLVNSGIQSAEDKAFSASIRIGRTSVGVGQGGAGNLNHYNLSLDAQRILKDAGFGYRGVYYDR